MSAADELRTAAITLRKLAADAAIESGNPRWTSSRVFPDQPDSTASVVRAEGARPVFRISQARYVRGPISDYVAAMGPNVGLALAKLLDDAAVDAEQIGADPHALALARLINTGSST